MLYIVGTYHDIQCQTSSNKEETDNFKAYLCKRCLEFGISCITEEFNEEAAAENGCEETCCRAVAMECGIDHLFCDPDRGQRTELGISDYQQLRRQQFFKNWTDDEFDTRLAEEHAVRETYWLNAIRSVHSDDDNILIVIGADHVKSFSIILENESEEFVILNEDYPNS